MVEFRRLEFGRDEGNRTLVRSLGICRSTIVNYTRIGVH